MQFRGCGTALVTPFRQDGSIDETALRNLVAWQVESGIDFLVPCGTTGETPTLSHDEWLQVIAITVEVVAGRVPIVAGATSNSTQDAVSKAKELTALSGVNGILTASPYYNKPTQEGQYRHFKAIAEAVGDKPIINVSGTMTALGASIGLDAVAKAMQSMDELFKGRHFEREIIILCVRWYLRYKLSLRDLVEMMAELSARPLRTASGRSSPRLISRDPPPCPI